MKIEKQKFLKIIMSFLMSLYILSIFFCMSNETDKLKNQVKIESELVLNLTSEGNLLRENNIKLENENKDMLEEMKKLKQQLDDVEEKYKKEIGTVSFNE
ncbi:hypothetical protein [Clostridium sp.]|jgi:cell division protein FtsB|nr:hypothetical protein [Clostridium sp.]